jgi:hypothetical protein
MGTSMAGIPLFQTPPWAIGVFYAVLGFAFGVLAERTNYCVVIATHQVMGVRYSRIYEIILTGIAVSAFLTGLLVALGVIPAVDAYAYMPGAGWYTVLDSFIFGFGIMLGQGCMIDMLLEKRAGLRGQLDRDPRHDSGDHNILLPHISGPRPRVLVGTPQPASASPTDLRRTTSRICCPRRFP